MNIMKQIFIFIFLIFFALPLYAGLDLSISDSNYTIGSQSVITDKTYIYNYNRLRLEADYYSDNIDMTLRIDDENILGKEYLNTPDYQFAKKYDHSLPVDIYKYIYDNGEIENRLYLYRAYATVRYGNHDFIAGLQRIPFGVGKIWTPTDVFNPVNPLSIETGERVGVMALRAELNPSDMTRIQITGNVKNDWKANKLGIRMKGVFKSIDAGISLITGVDFNMYGYELEMNIGSTGAELRSEGGYFNYFTEDNQYFKGILGVEYGFENSLIISFEYLFNGAGEDNYKDYTVNTVDYSQWNEMGKHYVATVLSYQISPLLTSNISFINNLSDQSYFISPSIEYSISDNINMKVGYQLFGGTRGSEFNKYNDILFINFNIYF